MPTDKQRVQTALRQQRFRQRQKQAREREQEEKGLPALPAVPSIPGTARWRGALKAAHALVNTIAEEMAAYNDERSDTWLESDAADLFQERQQELDDSLSLLARHPNVAARDVHGTTALLAAAAHCRLEILKALVHAGADVHDVKKDGTTALMYSLYNSDESVFYWLLSRSPDLKARGMGDNTALSIARQLREQAITTGHLPTAVRLRRHSLCELTATRALQH